MRLVSFPILEMRLVSFPDHSGSEARLHCDVLFCADTTPPKQVLRSGKVTIAEVLISLQTRLTYIPLIIPNPFPPSLSRLVLCQQPLSILVQRVKRGPCSQHSVSRVHSRHCRQRWPMSEGGEDLGEGPLNCSVALTTAL